MVLRMTMTQGKPEIPEDLIAKWQRDVQYVPIRLRQMVWMAPFTGICVPKEWIC